MSKEPAKSNLKTVILSAIMLSIFFTLAYFPVWHGLVKTWYRFDEYSHGFVIIPLCGYILWRKKEVLAKISTAPSLWGLGLVVFSLFFYICAHFAQIITLTSFSMLPMLAGVVIYIYGFQMLKEIIFPLFILLFMIPVPSQIYSSLTIPLQLLVTKASVWIGFHLGIPILREGNVINLPGQTLQVIDACSGLKSMISILALSAILGYFTLKSNILRTALFFFGIPASIFVNIVRVLLLVLAFYFFNYDLTRGIIHTIFGTTIFFLALVFIIIMKWVLSIWDRSASEK